MKQQITPFLAAAQDKGCPIQVGTDMLFEQIPAYLEFFGFGDAHPRRAAGRLPDQELTCRSRSGRRRVDGVEVAEVAPACTGWRCRWASTACPRSAPTCCTATPATCWSTAASPPGADGGAPDRTGPPRVAAALRAAGSSLERIARLVVTHAHIDHFGLAGEVVRRSGGELWMHEAAPARPGQVPRPGRGRRPPHADAGRPRAVRPRAHRELRGPARLDAGDALDRRPGPAAAGGERLAVGGRSWEVVHTPGHSPGHVCLWSAADRVLCSGDHLLQVVSPPVTFERGFERDPMGSYLDSLERVAALEPELVLPGHGPPFRDGARRAATIARGKRRRLDQVRDMVDEREQTVTEITADLFSWPADRRAAPFRDGGGPRRPCVSRGRGNPGAGAPAGRDVLWRPTGGDRGGRNDRAATRRRAAPSGTGWWSSAAGSAG